MLIFYIDLKYIKENLSELYAILNFARLKEILDADNSKNIMTLFVGCTAVSAFSKVSHETRLLLLDKT